MNIIQSGDSENTILVSVIIPSFNRVDLIGETIDSVLKQQCSFKFEIIIGDDFSNDNVRDVLLDFQKSQPEIIKLVFHERNLGLGANWASCVKLCSGKYIAGCDNDDFWHNKDKLNLQVQFLERNPEYGMVHTNYREYNRETGGMTEKNIHIVTYTESIIQTSFKGKFKCCNSSVMYRKSVIDEHINLDDYIQNQFPLQDWPTWISIANYTKFWCLPVSTTTVGVGNESITRPKDYITVLKRFEREKIMYKYLCDKFPDDLSFNEKAYDDYIDHTMLSLAYRRNDFSEAKKYAVKLKTAGSRSAKVFLSYNIHTFHIFILLKHLKAKLHSLINI